MWRSNEALSLEVTDVALCGEARISDCSPNTAAVMVSAAKSEPAQLAIITNQNCVTLLEYVVRIIRTERQRKLFNMSYAHFFLVIRRASTQNGFELVELTTQSWRHGGSLNLLLQSSSTETIPQRGRWKSASTLKRYLTNGRSKLHNMRFDDAAWASILGMKDQNYQLLEEARVLLISQGLRLYNAPEGHGEGRKD